MKIEFNEQEIIGLEKIKLKFNDLAIVKLKNGNYCLVGDNTNDKKFLAWNLPLIRIKEQLRMVAYL